MRLPSLLLVPVLAAAVLLTGCPSEPPVPRPRGFHRLYLPAHAYQKFECELCPFTFEYPAYGRVVMTRTDSCVFDIQFPDMGCTWHTTVEELTSDYSYHAAYEKYREMIHRHSSKGRIYESEIQTGLGSGRFFEIYGEVPTSAQFYFSDTSRYSIATSFYFETAQENDSLQPVIDHVKADLRHLISTLKWRPNYILPHQAIRCFPDSANSSLN